MRPEDKQKFGEIVTGFAELKGKQLSRAALNLYWNAMQSWSLDEFEQAANQLIQTCEFMPTPKEFNDLRKAGRPTVGEAWIKARRNASTAIEGGYVGRGAPCGDPLVDRAVEAIGGYGKIAMCDSDKLHFLERRFAEHYATIQEAEDTRDAVPSLLNERRRKHLSGPTRAGDVAARLGRDDDGND